MKNMIQLFICLVGCLVFRLTLDDNGFLAEITSAIGLYLAMQSIALFILSEIRDKTRNICQ